MDKQLIERIRKCASASAAEWIANSLDSIADELERIDAERGKDAVAEFRNGFLYPLTMSIPNGSNLFLHPAPTIPEGMALVPIDPTKAMLIEGRQADTDWMNSDDPEEEFEQGLAYIYNAMIVAAQGERK